MPRSFADVVKRVSRGYGIPVSQAAALLGSPVFVIQLDDLTDDEASDVFVLRRCFGVTTLSAGVAENAHIQLFNPVGSGVLVKVEQVGVNSDTAQVLALSLHDTELTTATTVARFRDRRISGNPAAVVRTESVAGVGTDVSLTTVLVSTQDIIPIEAILEEGQGILVRATVTNTNIRASYRWEEEAA